MSAPYEDYRDTDLEWLDRLPSDWRVRTVRHDVWVRARLGWKGLTADEYVDDGVPMLATPNITGTEIDYACANRITQERFDESPEIALRNGDVLLTKDGSTIGTVNVVRDLPEPATVNGSIAVLTPRHEIDGRFLYWFIASSYAQATFERLRGGMGVPHLFQRDINRINYPAPPLSDQRTIADHLHRETAKIDTLIEEQQRLIEMLRERRQAVIVNATGWGAEVPSTWTYQRISWLFGGTGSGTTPVPEDILDPGESTIPWVTTGELRERRITSTRKAVSREALESYSALKIHPAGSLLIAMYGATIGRMGILDVDAASNQACCALTDPTRVTPEFAQYSLLAARPLLLLDAAGGGQPNINQDKVRAFRIPVPPLDEQRRIVDYLDERTAKIDTLIAETERFIELSRERRAALITAVVTGQIDVREQVGEGAAA